jgi:4Fe-4S ferredoxin
MSTQSTLDCKQEPGVMMPVIDFNRCEGKAACVAICPENVFEIRRIADEDLRPLGVLQKIKLWVHGMQVAHTPNVDACRSCGLCVTACPEDALTLASVQLSIDVFPAGTAGME